VCENPHDVREDLARRVAAEEHVHVRVARNEVQRVGTGPSRLQPPVRLLLAGGQEAAVSAPASSVNLASVRGGAAARSSGSPLILRPDGGDAALGWDRGRVNDFGYARDPYGLACPRGAHVRRTNPRDGFAGHGRLVARHRILRRGMPYGEPLPEGAADDGADRGLVFVSFQASIERQFEIVQARWCNDGDAFGLGGTPDPLAGAVARPARIAVGARPLRLATAMRAHVTPRGGEYLFVPGIAALRALGAL
jgi:hypothetical protein